MNIKSDVKRRIKRRFKGLKKMIEQGLITKEYFLSVENSYKSHMSYGNCNSFIKNAINKYHNDIFNNEE